MPAPLRLLVLPLLAFAVLAAASVLAPAPGASAATSQQTTAQTKTQTKAQTNAQKRAQQRAARQHKVTRASSVALRQIGDRYSYGAAGPNSFDCSGLMKYSYSKAGLKLPRTSSAQARRAHRIPKSKLRRGDLMFFTDGGGVHHAAMFLKWTHGRAVMVHAPGSGQRVRRDHPWTKQWFGATLRY